MPIKRGNLMGKMLYIDNPFQGEKGGDKNRSKFIWQALKDQFDVDLMIIKNYQNPDYQYQPHTGQKDLYEITSTKPGLIKPEAILKFSTQELKKFENLLKQKQYEYIFIRFAAPYALADLAAKILPKAKIVFDIDMLMSRLTKLSWELKPTLRNRYFYIQNRKFIQFEKELFNKPYLFLFTNYLEMEMAQKNSVKPNFKGKFSVLPNVMRESNYPFPEVKKSYVLFFGTLNSAANSDAFEFLADDIYPLIEAKLKEMNTTIRIVGRNKTAAIEQKANTKPQIDLIGEVDDIDKEIAESLFTILPIRIASGTRTRILEAANLKTAVISTTIGAEGFEFESDEIIIKDIAVEFAEEMVKLLDNPNIAKQMGEKILQKSKEKYLDNVVAKNLIEQIKCWNPERRK